jgi:hypothetical protein
MSIHDIQHMKTLIQELGTKLAEKEKFFTGILAARLSKAAQDNPGDQTIIGMHNFLNERSRKPNGTLISKTELKDVYNKLYTRNSRCSEYLSTELGKTAELLEPKVIASPEVLEKDLVTSALEKATDGKLLNELSVLFDKQAGEKSYTKAAEQSALRSCQRVLPGNPILNIVAGREDLIVCEAAYETPKGRSAILVPVEVINNKALLPTVFMHKDGFETIASETITDKVVKHAGQKFNVNVNDVFNIIDNVRGSFNKIKPLSEVEKIVIKASLESQTPSSYDNNAVFQELNREEKTVEESALSKDFASMLHTAKGAAEFKFGKEAVELGRKLIINKLASNDIRDAQVSVFNIDENSIIYSVASASLAFKVPVTVKNKKVQDPNIIIANGMVKEFVKNSFIVSDLSVKASVYNIDSSKPGQLIENVKVALASGDKSKAETVLEIIASTGDQSALNYAFELYTKYLNGSLNKTASTQQKIKTVKIGGNEVCAKTGLPIDKVYIDENGDVKAKYRQNMEHTDLGAVFINSKIFSSLT